MRKNKILLLFALLLPAGIFGQTDSLNHYLKTAAENNPSVKAAFHAYEASLQRVPQMGAIEDPQLEIGFFIEPMDLVGGRQLAQFQLMQMFPWFGTRKAARTEAQHMAKMAFEQFRETRDNLYLEIYTQWYALGSLQQRLRNNEENKKLLEQLETLATEKFKAPLNPSTGAASGKMNGNASIANANTNASGGMGSMGMGGASVQNVSSIPPSGNGGSMGGMEGGSASGMSEILRIHLEINELESNIESLRSEIIAGKVRFNALLNRDAASEVVVRDSLLQIPFLLDAETVMHTVEAQNPMLGMINEESLAYKAKAEMTRKMGYPMFGIGLQYMLIGKSDENTALNHTNFSMDDASTQTAMNDMNGKDMIMPMLSVSIPIYRGKYKAAQKESRLLQQASAEKYADTYNRLRAGLYQSKHLLDDAARKIALYRKQSVLAQSIYNLSVQEFISGKSDLANVIQVQRQLLDYKLQEAEAVAAYNTMVANVQKMISTENEE